MKARLYRTTSTWSSCQTSSRRIPVPAAHRMTVVSSTTFRFRGALFIEHFNAITDRADNALPVWRRIDSSEYSKNVTELRFAVSRSQLPLQKKLCGLDFGSDCNRVLKWRLSVQNAGIANDNQIAL